jgi:hypothetical protein
VEAEKNEEKRETGRKVGEEVKHIMNERKG